MFLYSSCKCVFSQHFYLLELGLLLCYEKIKKGKGICNMVKEILIVGVELAISMNTVLFLVKTQCWIFVALNLRIICLHKENTFPLFQ